MVSAHLYGTTSDSKDEITTALELVVTSVVLLHSDASLFVKLSKSTLQVGLSCLTMPLGERPLVTDSPTNKKDFAEVIDENCPIDLHVSWLIALKGGWHR
jgi:hypothetical protein